MAGGERALAAKNGWDLQSFRRCQMRRQSTTRYSYLAFPDRESDFLPVRLMSTRDVIPKTAMTAFVCLPTVARTGRFTMHARHRRETLFPSRNVGHARCIQMQSLALVATNRSGMNTSLVGSFDSAPHHGDSGGSLGNDADLFTDRLAGHDRVTGGVHELERAPKDRVGRPILSEKSLQPQVLIPGNALPLSQSKNPAEPLRLRDRLVPVPDPEGIPCLGIVDAVGGASIEPALIVCNRPALGEGTTRDWHRVPSEDDAQLSLTLWKLKDLRVR
jgi:hypothetical protein